jgi:hypothetical protein
MFINLSRNGFGGRTIERRPGFALAGIRRDTAKEIPSNARHGMKFGRRCGKESWYENPVRYAEI